MITPRETKPEWDALADVSVQLFSDEKLRKLTPDDYAIAVEAALSGNKTLRHDTSAAPPAKLRASALP